MKLKKIKIIFQFQILSESNVVAVLMSAAMQVWMRSGHESGSCPKEEPTLKVILSALWNLSAHCRKNKVTDTKKLHTEQHQTLIDLRNNLNYLLVCWY